MSKDSQAFIARSARRFSYGTLVSRVTGLLREMIMAAAFGALPAVAAFWMAFRFAHLFRRIFGEGALNAAFIPYYETLKARSPQEGASFFAHLTLSVTTLLAALVLVGEGVLLAFIRWGSLSSGAYEVCTLLALLLPSLVFICLYALNTALLNCEKKFFLPSVAPAFLNLTWVGALLLLWHTSPPVAMRGLAMILVGAFALQWLSTLPAVYSRVKGGLFTTKPPQVEGSIAALLKIVAPFALGVLGVAATQINSALDALFARAADPSGPATLWYAIRLQQLPLALFGVGLSAAALPPIARALQQGETSKAAHFFTFACKRAHRFMVPLTFGLIACGLPMVNLLYGRGAFSASATAKTGHALFCYALALLPTTLVILRASYFYAKKEYRIPALLSCAALGCNVFLNTLFVFVLGLGAASVALATSVTALLHSLALRFFLAPHVEKARFSKGRLELACVVALMTTLFFMQATLNDNTLALLLQQKTAPFARHFAKQLGAFLASAAVFSTSLLVSMRLVGLNLATFYGLRIRKLQER